MVKELRPPIILLIALTPITSLLYAVAIAGGAQVLFPYQANGSLIIKDGNGIGSERIGQLFADAKYFHGRPSATTKPDPNDSSKTVDANSAGANLGPTNKAQIERVKADMEKLKAENPTASIPIDLVATSGSGLDPDISPEAAPFQVTRVAKARNMPEDRIRDLVNQHVGEPRVNVLNPNRAFDRLAGG
jgi:potassium-transporting ATPase KdpC subunit